MGGGGRGKDESGGEESEAGRERGRGKKEKEVTPRPGNNCSANDSSGMWLVWRANSLVLVYLRGATGEGCEEGCGMTWHKAHPHTCTHCWN